MEKNKHNHSLRTLPPDNRDFSLGAFKTLPELKDLPPSFRLPYRVKNQGDTDLCSAYATCAVSEAQEGFELIPEYTFASSKLITGDIEEWGQDLRSACKAHVKFGALAAYEIPETFLDSTPEKLRDFATWQDYQSSAELHKKQSYFLVTGPYDAFDNIRATLYQYQTPIAIGIQFGYPLTQKTLNKIKTGYGHAMTVIGYEVDEDGEPVLIVGNSYGEEAGDRGVHYITREVINHWFDTYGAFTFVDVDPEQVKYNQKYGIRPGDNWLIQIGKVIKTFIYGGR